MAIKTRYTEIRAEMVRRGLDGAKMAEALGISRITYSNKLCAHIPFTSREMYTILDLFGRPDSDIALYFPRNGISDPTSYRKLPTDLPMRNSARITSI